MKGSPHCFSLGFVLFALISSLASAYDPSPLQDFCVAINHTKDNGKFILYSVYVNGKFCKDPKLVTAKDFYFSGLNTPGIPQPSGFFFKLVNVYNLPGVNTLGTAIVRHDQKPGGVVPVHTHPRATEMVVVMEGTLLAGFVTSYPEYRLFAKVLYPGDVFVYPIGLIHFQYNGGKTNAVSFGFYNSQDPGIIPVANAVFGSNPPINLDALAKSFDLDNKTVSYLQKQFGMNN